MTDSTDVSGSTDITDSQDVNYRGRLWTRDEAHALLGPIARHASILIASDDELDLVASAALSGADSLANDDAETALAMLGATASGTTQR